MEETPRSNRFWLRRVRELQRRQIRQDEGVCFVEGIRQVVAAREGNWTFEAILVDPSRLRSDIAWAEVQTVRSDGGTVVELTTSEFEKISSRDNPTGIAAIVRWRPLTLSSLPVGHLYVVTDDISDPGNLGTLARTCDSFCVSGLIVHGGVDPAHPGALRASLGTMFRLPVASAGSLDEVFHWCTSHNVKTVATSAKAPTLLQEFDFAEAPVAILLGNEGRGLAAETLARCDEAIKIPMRGTATSLNIGVAAGIVLYEALR